MHSRHAFNAVIQLKMYASFPEFVIKPPLLAAAVKVQWQIIADYLM